MSFVKVKNSATVATSARRALMTALTVTSLSFAAIGAHAEAPLQRIEVSLAGLNLATQADARTAYSRLRAAAQKVCHGVESTERRGHLKFDRCYQEALSNAVADVGNGNISSLHLSDRNVRVAQRETAQATGS
jgi:UrcA family protein